MIIAEVQKMYLNAQSQVSSRSSDCSFAITEVDQQSFVSIPEHSKLTLMSVSSAST